MTSNYLFYTKELLPLYLLSQNDLSMHDLYIQVHKHTQTFTIGTLFTMVYFFEKTNLISSYQNQEQTIYHIEEAGKVRLDTLTREYYEQINNMSQTIGGS